MAWAASSSLRGSSVPGLPLMVLGGLLHRSRSWRGAVLTLHSLVGLLYRPVVASHLPRASGSPRHQSAPSERQSLSWGGSLRPYKHTHKKPGLNRLYCGGVSECTVSKNLTRPVGKCRSLAAREALRAATHRDRGEYVYIVRGCAGLPRYFIGRYE